MAKEVFTPREARAALDEILRGRGGLMEVIGDSQLIADFLVSGAKKIPKGTSPFIRQVLELTKLAMTKQQRAAVIAADIEKRAQVAESKIAEIETRSGARIAERGAGVTEQIRLKEAGTEQAVARAEQIPVATEIGKIEAEKLRASEEARLAVPSTQAREASQRALADLRTLAVPGSRKVLPDPTILEQRYTIASLTPEGKAEVDLIKSQIEERKAVAVLNTRKAARSVTPLLLEEGELPAFLKTEINATGRPISKVRLKEAAARLQTEGVLLEEAAAQGVTFQGGKIPKSGMDFIETRGRVPGLGKAGVPRAEQTFKLAAQAIEGKRLEEGSALFRQALKGLKGGRLLRGGLLGGLGAGLLTLLSRGKGQEGQENPAMQIQLLQQLAQQQQQQQLAQSLIGQRGAASERDMARAALLRLQALTAAGGPAPAVV